MYMYIGCTIYMWRKGLSERYPKPGSVWTLGYAGKITEGVYVIHGRYFCEFLPKILENFIGKEINELTRISGNLEVINSFETASPKSQETFALIKFMHSTSRVWGDFTGDKCLCTVFLWL
jgi:hypothetical protein